jgi:hypothetical protein
MKKVLGRLILLASATLVAGTVSASDDRWIHVRVDETDGAKGRVDIQVPVGMVSSLLPVLKGKHAHGSVKVDCKDVDLAELRGYWNAVRSAKDGDYVTVHDEESDVRISKSGGFLRLTVDEKDGGGRVRMKVPLTLVDAAFAGDDSIDLEALGHALAKVPVGEILTVDDDDSHVRIWIDAQAAPAREERQ